MTPFLQYGPYVAIDFETSAWSGANACAIGMVRMENLEIVASFYSLIRPPSSRVYYTKVHGLTWKDLQDQRPFAEVWPEIAAFIKGARYLIAHNARFDSNVLNACCAACGIEPPAQRFLCTLRGARKGLRLKGYSLSAVSSYFGIELDHHNAGSDARACGLIHSRLTELGVTNTEMFLPEKTTGKKA